MKRLVWGTLDAAARRAALARPERRSDPALIASVRAIVDDVRVGGWNAAVAHAERIDGAMPHLIAVAPLAAEARATLSAETIAAIELARRNIAAFHAGSVPADHVVRTVPGVTVRKTWRPIDRVGLYVPGGTTPLFSTLLMLALPARAAGVAEIFCVTPPRPGGGLDPAIALAAELCGIDSIWTIGGAQAIAALAFGAGDVPAVAKICGPGNAYVAEAKTYVASLPGGPAIDLPAGPSELMVIADASADPDWVAADLLSQAEHDAGAQVLLVTPSEELADGVAARIARQLETLPRGDIARAALEGARLIVCESLAEAADIANAYAPEHLSLAVADADALLPAIRNAGAVFAGHAAAETFGDYLAGSSHVLPTDGAARAWSGVSALTFMKAMSVQTVSADAARGLAAPAAALARLEGLEAHALAAEARGDRFAHDDKIAPRGIERLARPEILSLPPIDVSASANELFGPDAIRLDANENPFPPLSEDALAGDINRYPEPQPAALRQTLAALYAVRPDSLLVTRGGDDAIDLLIRTFCRPGVDAISICPPTFSAYAQFARLHGARVIEVPLEADFAFDADRLINRARRERNLKLAFLCSPNNPTGGEIAPREVLRVAEALPDTIVVLDEAYIDFSAVETLAAQAAARDNVVVLRTLSKAWGLAGARVGCAVAHPATIALLARALPPYPLPSLSVRAVMKALAPSRRAVQIERVARIVADRALMAERLAAAPIVRRVHAGGGNFLFLEVDDPAALAATLQARGIRVRFRPQAAPGGVRVTIGTEAENAAVLAAFGVLVDAPAARRAALTRDTKETRIAASIDLDAESPRNIATGVPFYDHMLDQVAAHGGFALTLACDGDLDIDAHHSIEDCAIVLGGLLSRALADRRGIGRFGFALPMDEAEAQVLIDLSGRPFCRFEGAFAASHIGAYPTEMTPHVFRSIADTLGAAIHVTVTGDNDHHKTEVCFKAFGRALRGAIRRDGNALPSTKGVL